MSDIDGLVRGAEPGGEASRMRGRLRLPDETRYRSMQCGGTRAPTRRTDDGVEEISNSSLQNETNGVIPGGI